jgi:hypothetical protein
MDAFRASPRGIFLLKDGIFVLSKLDLADVQDAAEGNEHRDNVI